MPWNLSFQPAAAAWHCLLAQPASSLPLFHTKHVPSDPSRCLEVLWENCGVAWGFPSHSISPGTAEMVSVPVVHGVAVPHGCLPLCFYVESSVHVPQ